MVARQWRIHVIHGIFALVTALTTAGCKLQTSIKDLKNPEGLPILTMNSATIIEGQTGVMVLSLDKPATKEVAVTYYYTDGTAVLAQDYTGTMGILTIAVGATQGLVPLASPDDSIYEGDEVFYVNLIAPANAMAASGVLSQPVTLVDNEVRPKVFITDASASEGGGLTFNVSLDHQSVEAVQFDWSTFAGTAFSGVDFTAGTGHISIAPLGLLSSIVVSSLQDTLYEPSETFEVRASNLVHASAGRITATGTILDDDSVPQISVYDASVIEGGTALFAVSLSAVSGQPVVFSWQTFTGTASGADFTSVAVTSVTISAGSTSINLPVITTQDAITEPNENFSVSLSAVTGASVLDGLASGTIVDDDGLPYLVVWAAPTVTEGAVSNVVVSLSSLSGLDVTFNYSTYDDTAVSTEDYTTKSGVGTILAGSLSLVIPVTTLDDARDEISTEYYRLSISSAVNANILTDSALSGINDNDSPPTLYVTDASTTEGGTLIFWATLSAASDLNVDFNYSTQDGTALQPGDYTQLSNVSAQIVAGNLSVALPVVTTQDAVYEASENMSVTLTALTNASASDTFGLGTITDNDPSPQISIYDLSINEGATGQFVVSLSGASSLDVVFNWRTHHDTTQAADYTSVPLTSRTITAGSLSILLPVVTTQDFTDEYDQTFFVSLSSITNASALDDLAVGTILDDDGPPNWNMSTITAVTEGTDSAPQLFQLSGSSEKDIVVTYQTYDGTALAGQDYTATSGTTTITGGQTIKYLTVPTIDDSLNEASPEYYTISITSITNASLVTNSRTGDVLDNDSAPSLYVTDASTTEGGTLTFWATLSAISGQNVAFNYSSQNGTAVQPADYTASSGSRTILAGSLSVSLNVVTVQDTLYENSETLSVTLTALTNASASDTFGLGTITDNDTQPALSLTDAALTEGATATLWATLSAVSGVAVTFNYATQDGTAAQPADYTSATGTLTIPAGNLSVSLNAVSVQDALYESTENFTVTLTALSGASAADTLGVVTINDDETQPNLVIYDASVTEGGTLRFTVSLSSAAGSNVTFSYQSFDGTATTGNSDYSAVTGVGTLASGSLTYMISMVTNQDPASETDETLTISLSSVTVANLLDGTAVGTILNDDSTMTITLTDVYSGHGNWNDYIKANNGGTNQFDQPNTVCAGTENYYFGCIHGGEKKKASLAGVTSCSNITASDSLGAFNWLCDASSGTAIIYMGGLKEGKGLRDLINPTGPAWRNNQLTVLNGASTIAQTASGVWWQNSIVDLPDNSSSAAVSLSTNPTPAYGPIYTYSSDRLSNGYYLSLPKSAIVGLNNAVLRYAGSSSNNCDGWAANMGTPDNKCLVFSDQGFSWIEINGRGDNSPATAYFNIFLFGSHCRIRNSSSFNAGGAGIKISGDHAFVDHARAFNNGGQGLYVYYSDYLTFYRSTFANNSSWGFDASFDHQIMTQVASLNNDDIAWNAGGNYSTMTHSLVLNSAGLSGIMDWAGNNNTWSQMTGYNISAGGSLGFSGGATNNTVLHSALSIDDSSSGNFYSTVVNTTPNLDASFVGKVTQPDSTNTSDSYGLGSYSLGLDWINFDNPFRSWGKYSILAFPNASHIGACTSGTCQIWDWRLRSTDTTLLNRSGNGSTANPPFLNNQTCPSPVNGNVTVTDTSGRTYLINATEVMGDGLGNENTLCESGEACIYSPNIGPYQGEGDYTTLKCNFQNGTVTNVTMYAYPVNGVVVPPDLWIADASTTEGGTLVLAVSLTAAVAGDVTFNFQTYNGTATSGSDYTAASGSGTILSGNLTTSIRVVTTQDSVYESNETMSVTLSGLSTLVGGGRLSAIGTIADNDPANPNSPDLPMYVQGAQGLSGTAADGYQDFTSANTAGNLIVVVCKGSNTIDTLAVYDSAGNTYTPVTSQTRTSVGKAHMFYAKNILAATSNRVHCTSTASALQYVGLAEYSGLSTATPFDASNQTSGNGGTLAVSLTTTQPYDLIVSHSSSLSNGTKWISDSDVSSRQRGNHSTIMFEDRIAPVAGSYTQQDRQSASAAWLMIVAAFKWNGNYASRQGIYLSGGINDQGLILDAVLKSVDNGKNWQAIGTLPVGLTDHCTLAYNNALWVIGGFDPNTSLTVNTVYKSTDGGSTWTSAGTLPLAIDEQACLVYNNKMWAIGGTTNDDFSGAQNVVWSSSDGLIWNTEGSLPGLRMGIGATVFNNKIWAFGGRDLSNNTKDTVWWSTDGSTWSTAGTSVLPAPRAEGVAVTHNGSYWYIGGTQNISTGNTNVWSCGDPCASWTTQTALPTNNWYGGGTSLNGKLVLAGGIFDSSVRSTTTGGSWTTESQFLRAANPDFRKWVATAVGPYDAVASVYIMDVASVTEGQTAQFAVTLSAAQSYDVTFNYQTIPGTATAGSDYTSANGVGTILAGQLAVTIPVIALDDSINEMSPETLSVTLTAIYNAISGDSSADGNILDNDAVPSLFISDASAVTEGQTAAFTVSLSAASGQNVTFNFSTVDGTAVSTQDYTARTSVGTIPAGSLTYMLTVLTTDDSPDEVSPENFTVSLTASTNSTISDGSGLGTINDNDAAPNLLISDASATEGSTLTFWVTIGAISDQNVTFSYTTMDGAATLAAHAPGDYTSASGSTTITAGSLSVAIQVVSVQDTVPEYNEQFLVSLSSLTNTTVVDNVGVGTINDDDTAPNLYVLDSTVTEGQTATLWVTMSKASGADVTFNFATQDGTATTTDSDYTSTSGTKTISAGSLSISINVVSIQDSTIEANETLSVTLTSPGFATVSDGYGLITINNDDTSSPPPNPVFVQGGSAQTVVLSSFYYTWNPASANPSDWDHYQVEVFNNGTCASSAVTTLNTPNNFYQATLISGVNSLRVTSYVHGGAASSAVCSSTITYTLPSDFVTGYGSSGFNFIEFYAGSNDIQDLAVIASDKILVAGKMMAARTKSDYYVGRLNSDGSWDTSFGTMNGVTPVLSGDGTNFGTKLRVQSNGKILVAGTAYVSGQADFAVSRLNSDGTVDTSFGKGGTTTLDFAGQDDFVYSMGVFTTGKVILVGSTYNGTNTDFAMALLNADGTVDTGFGTSGKKILTLASGDEDLSGVAIDSSGQIFVGGTMPGGATAKDIVVMKITSAGAYDTAFNTTGYRQIDLSSGNDDLLKDIAIDGNGKIVAVARADGNIGVARLNSNGSFDTTFNTTGKATFGDGVGHESGILIAPDNSILIPVGAWNAGGGYSMGGLAKVAANGLAVSLWQSYDQGRHVLVRAVGLLSTGKPVVGGVAPGLTDTDDIGTIIRVNSADYTLDTSFQSVGYRWLNDFSKSVDRGNYAQLMTGDKVVVAATVKTGIDSILNDQGIARLTSAGGLDATFNSNGKAVFNLLSSGYDAPNGEAVAADGSIFTAANAWGAGDVDILATKYTSAGALDTGFDADGVLKLDLNSSDYSGAIALQSDGKVVVAGSTAGGANIFISRLTTTGTMDTTFNTTGTRTVSFLSGGTVEDVQKVIVQSDGKILATGTEWSTLTPLIRLTSAGALDTTFNTTGKAQIDLSTTSADSTWDAKQLSSGKYLLVGHSNDATQNAIIARVNSNGSLDTTFGTTGRTVLSGACHYRAYSVATTADESAIYIAGSTCDDNVAIWKMNASGTLDSAFGTSGLYTINLGGVDEAYTIMVASDGKLIVTGTTDARGSEDVFAFEMVDNSLPPDLFIADATVSEGGTLNFLVSISKTSASNVTFNFATVASTATAGTDYTTTSGTKTIAAGQLTLSIPVVTAQDSLYEATETLTLSLSSVANANAVDNLGVGQINDDDTAPNLYVLDSTVTEGGTATIWASISAASGTIVSFNYATQAGTATAGSDYTSTSGTETILAGSLSVSFNVVSLQDSTYEGSENLSVTLTSVAGATGLDTLGQINITDDDAAPTIKIYAASVTESSTLQFLVSLSATSAANATFNYSTYDGTGTALDSDYTAVSNQALTIAAGALTTYAIVATIPDTKYEANETLTVSLSSVSNATVAVVGTDDKATGTINNNDTMPALFINDVSSNEGTTGVFTVSLDAVSGLNSVFTWQTYNSTATAGSDYTGVPATTVTIAAGQLTGSLTVASIQDSYAESDETLTITLSSLTNVSGGDTTGVGTIVDDDTVSYPVTPMLVQRTTGWASPGLSASLTFTRDNSAGHLIVVFFDTNSSTATFTVSDTRGNTYAQVGSTSNAGLGQEFMYYAYNIAAGPNTVTVSSVTSTNLNVSVLEYSGVSTTSPLDVWNVNSGTSTTPSLTLTTTQARDLVVVDLDHAAAVNATSTPDLVFNDSYTNGYSVQKVVGTAGAVTISSNLSTSGAWMSIGAAFKPASGTDRNQAIYMIGGSDDSPAVRAVSTVLKSTDYGYNWTHVGNIPAARIGGCSYAMSGYLYFAGGFDGSSSKTEVYRSSDGGLSWSTIGNLPQPRSDGACIIHSNKMWFIGGTSDGSVAASHSEVYSSSDGITWSHVGDIPLALTGIRGTSNGTRMFAAGGFNTSGATVTNAWQSTDGITWSTSGAAALPSGRAWGAMDYDPRWQVVFYVGGSDGMSSNNNVWTCPDPCSSWSIEPNLPIGTRGHGLISANGSGFVLGGANTDTLQSYTDSQGSGLDWQNASPAWPVRRIWAGVTANQTESTLFKQYRVNSTNVNSNNVTSGAFSASVTTGNLVVCWAEYGSTTVTISSVTDNKSNVYTRALAPTTGMGERTELWYNSNVTGGASLNVTATLSGTFNAYKALHCSEYAGVQNSGALEQATATSVTQTNVKIGPVTTTYANQLIFGHIIYQGSGNPGPNGVPKFIYNGNLQFERIVHSPGTYSFEGINSSMTGQGHIVTFKLK